MLERVAEQKCHALGMAYLLHFPHFSTSSPRTPQTQHKFFMDDQLNVNVS